MLVAVLIGIMISIVVGVSLIPTIQATLAAAKEPYLTAGGSSWISGAPVGLFSLIDVLPYVFVAVILLGAVAWIGGQG